MAELTVIWWRAIPAQVVAREGRTTARVQLTSRFQEAIDMAATRVGLIGTDDYLNEWHRETRPCGDDLDAEAAAEAERLEQAYPDAALDTLVRAGGLADGRSDRVTDTVVSSATREVVIGSGRPFVIIGERINPTGRKKLAEEMKAGDYSTVIVDAMAQVEAGRADAGRERRHPARRRARDPGGDRAARAVAHRRAAVDRLVDRRRAWRPASPCIRASRS